MADTFSVRLPDELRAEVDKMADDTKRSRAFIIKEAVEAYVSEHRAYQAAIDEALIQADKGIFVSGDKVFAWLEDLKTNPDAPVPEPDVFKK